MNDHPLHDRLARHLDQAARTTTLRPGSQLGVVRTARRRTARRRQLTAAASVVAVGGVAVVGIQQLADTRPSLQGAEPSDQAAPPALADGLETAPTAPPQAGAPAATLGDPQLVWRAVRPDAAGAVSGSFGRSESFAFPGLILSTAPAPAQGTPDPDFVPTLWRSDDGITFSPVESNVPDGFKLFSARVLGDRVYTFGTAPGVAATDPNPLLASVTRDGGATWSDVLLPFDTHGLRDIPGIKSSGSEVAGISVQGEAVLVLVRGFAQPDFEALGIENPDETVILFESGGVLMQEDTACTPVSLAPMTTAVHDAAALEQGEVTDSTVGDVGGCATTLVPWSDFDLSAEAQALLSAQSSTKLFYAADGQTFTELSLPGEGIARHVSLPSSTMHLVSLVDDEGVLRLHRTSDGATWEPLPPLPRHASNIVEVGGRLVAIHNDGGAGSQLLTSTLDGASWTTVDLSSAVGTGYHFIGAVGSGPAGLAVAVVEPGSPTDLAAGATTLPTEGTGAPDTSPASGPDSTWRVHLLHTTDGLTWSAEELTGVMAAPGTVPNVVRIASVGNQLVVNVSLSLPGTEMPEHVALVGTPRG